MTRRWLFVFAMLLGTDLSGNEGVDYDQAVAHLAAHPAVSAALRAVARIEQTNIDRLIELAVDRHKQESGLRTSYVE